MLYYLFTYLRDNFHLAGAGVFNYITFRVAMAIILSLGNIHAAGQAADQLFAAQANRRNRTRPGPAGRNTKERYANDGRPDHHKRYTDTYPAFCTCAQCVYSIDAGIHGMAGRCWLP